MNIPFKMSVSVTNSADSQLAHSLLPQIYFLCFLELSEWDYVVTPVRKPEVFPLGLSPLNLPYLTLFTPFYIFLLLVIAHVVIAVVPQHPPCLLSNLPLI